MSGVDRLNAGLTVSGSLLSTFGTLFILVCYLILPHKQHIRHALIVNLTLADFINALNNSVSGLTVLIRNKDLADGPFCVANGYLGQLSVQAVDCSILAITVVTLWTVKAMRTNTDIPLRGIIGVCAASWVLPVTTSFIALFKGYYHPVGANWCWIQVSPIYLRYALTHGWRFLIILIVVGICIYIQVYLHRLFRAKPALDDHIYFPQEDRKGSVPSLRDIAAGDLSAVMAEEGRNVGHASTYSSYLNTDDDIARESLISRLQRDEDPHLNMYKPYADRNNFDAQLELPQTKLLPPRVSFATPSTGRDPGMSRKIMAEEGGAVIIAKEDRSVEKTMLLNAYPILYILLWIPGIANRIAEASGHPQYFLEVAQASTQFIGIANAITFGWNEDIYKHLKARVMEKCKSPNRRRWTMGI